MVGWHYIEDRSTTQSGAAVLVLGSVTLVGIAVLRLVSILVGVAATDGAFTPVAFFGEIVGYTVLTAAVLLLPWVAITIEDRPLVRRLQSQLPFSKRTVNVETTQRSD
ncbi:hypothetical protein D8S78_03200 [Natrialba swarupiae]|nr:hypothetical protein [Natrialba swarupiae]